MTKVDWGVLQIEYEKDHEITGISPKDWADENNLVYATARRYLKKKR
ncbi:MAG: hypothetical protein HRU25_11895 [Psychrobium sp.]|nr:hypothetical protein [Psychrobium sp.]